MLGHASLHLSRPPIRCAICGAAVEEQQPWKRHHVFIESIVYLCLSYDWLVLHVHSFRCFKSEFILKIDLDSHL